MERGRARTDQAQTRRRPHSPSSEHGSHRGRCCISARASGIRANKCRDGRLDASGARTACLYGKMSIWSRMKKRDYGVSADDSALFFEALAARLGVDTNYIMPAYEDAWYYLWKERRLPANVDPLESHLEDELERARLARVFEQSLDKVVGHVLPIKRERQCRGAAWTSGTWFLRPETTVSCPRRFTHWISSAAGLASLGHRFRIPTVLRTRPVGRARPSSRAAGRATGSLSCAPEFQRTIGNSSAKGRCVRVCPTEPTGFGQGGQDGFRADAPARGVCAMDRPDRDGR